MFVDIELDLDARFKLFLIIPVSISAICASAQIKNEIAKVTAINIHMRKTSWLLQAIVNFILCALCVFVRYSLCEKKEH